MAVEVYLVFDGDFRQAVEFYSQVFRTEIIDLTTFRIHHSIPITNFPKRQKIESCTLDLKLAAAGPCSPTHSQVNSSSRGTM